MMKSKHLIIAVDGPAASGKGTLAKRLAEHFGLRYLDTGLIYRAVARELVTNKMDPLDIKQAESAALKISDESLIDTTLRSEEIGRIASIIAAYQSVRAEVLGYQRRFSASSPGAVLDGRDIGTIVCPDATAKIYLDANLEVRAIRRSKELHLRGSKSIESHVLNEMRDRDQRDSERIEAPLAIAKDAYRIDTSCLSPLEVFEKAVFFINSRYG